jgi:hypothetical protein
MGVEHVSGIWVGTGIFVGLAAVSSIFLAVYVKAKTRDLSQKKDNCV